MHYEQKAVVGLLVMGLAGSGCAMPRPAQSVRATPLVLERETVQLEGWFSAKGEWMVNPTKDYQTYNPLGKDEADRCVSVVNGMGSDRSDFAALDGKQVVVTGFAIPYQEVPIGPAQVDRILSKRYFKNEIVFNFCLRELVFVAQSIQPK
jgi:hypothetical protein